MNAAGNNDQRIRQSLMDVNAAFAETNEAARRASRAVGRLVEKGRNLSKLISKLIKGMKNA